MVSELGAPGGGLVYQMLVQRCVTAIRQSRSYVSVTANVYNAVNGDPHNVLDLSADSSVLPVMLVSKPTFIDSLYIMVRWDFV